MSIHCHTTRYTMLYDGIRTASSPIKSPRRCIRLRCDSIRFVYNSDITPTDPLNNPIGSHPGRVKHDQTSKAFERLRCDSIKSRYEFYRTPAGQFYNPIGVHPDRIKPNHTSKAVHTIAMRFYKIRIRLL
jgi:hypothetical protein